MFFINIERLLLVIIIQGVPETCDSQGYTAWAVTYFCFCKSVLRNSIVLQCALDCCRFFGTPCILYYTVYSLKETLRDQCTPTQKVMLLLFIINPLIQENTNNVVKGTSNKAFCLFKVGFDSRPVQTGSYCEIEFNRITMLQGGRLTSFIICSKPDIFLLTFSDQAWFFDNP